MSKLSKQGVFDVVYDYYKQGGATGYDNLSCVYFVEDTGGHCAVGVLLDHVGINREDLQDEGDEGDGTDYNTDCTAEGLVEFLGERLTDRLEDDVFEEVENETDMFLQRMQKAHDRIADMDNAGSAEVTESLERFAINEDLIVPD